MEEFLELGPRYLMKLEYVLPGFASMDLLPSLKPSVPFYDMQVKGITISFFSFGTPLVVCLCRKMMGKLWKNLVPSAGNHLHHLPGLFYTDDHSSLLGEAP